MKMKKVFYFTFDWESNINVFDGQEQIEWGKTRWKPKVRYKIEKIYNLKKFFWTQNDLRTLKYISWYYYLNFS